MSHVASLADHLAPDSINRLERAAQGRCADANVLILASQSLGAVYLLGYCVEMCLTAAYYRSAGFAPNESIDRDTRQRHMANARQLKDMDADPHPLVGWAKSLQRNRRLAQTLTVQEEQRLSEAVNRAAIVYKHWRPELRYKTIAVTQAQLDEVKKVADWFIDQRGRL